MDHGDAQARRASRSATSTIPSPLRSAHDAYVARHQPCVRGGHQPTGRGIGKNRTSFCYSRAPRGFLTCIWRRLVLGVAAWTPAAARAMAMSFIMVAGRPIAERTFVVVRGVRTPRRPTDWRKIGRDLSPGVVVLQQNTTRVFRTPEARKCPWLKDPHALAPCSCPRSVNARNGRKYKLHLSLLLYYVKYYYYTMLNTPTVLHAQLLGSFQVRPKHFGSVA